MTAYEQGFLTKCAEYGLGEKSSMYLLAKRAEEHKNYAGPIGALAATVGGGLSLPIAVEDFRHNGLASVEDMAENISAMKNLDRDLYRDYSRHGLRPFGAGTLPKEDINRVRQGATKLLEDATWVRNAGKQVRAQNLLEALKVPGKISAGAALLGVPAYAIAKIIQNAKSKKK